MINFIRRRFAARADGFTLIEILVVIGIIAILATVVIVAINPARQFAQARDSQRMSNLNTILNAIGQNMADNKGIFTCGTVVLPAAAAGIDSASGGAGVDLSCLVPIYVPTLPTDPSGPVSPSTGYSAFQDINGRIHVLATAHEASIPRATDLEIVR